MADKLKLLLAILIIVAGVIAFYYFDGWLQVARVGLILVTFALGFAVALTSETGKTALQFASKANSERKKVVWPARPEATQVTVMVLVGAVITSLFIWMVDSVLFKVVYGWILGT